MEKQGYSHKQLAALHVFLWTVRSSDTLLQQLKMGRFSASTFLEQCASLPRNLSPLNLQYNGDAYHTMHVQLLRLLGTRLRPIEQDPEEVSPDI